jgi:hypothetical protein
METGNHKGEADLRAKPAASGAEGVLQISLTGAVWSEATRMKTKKEEAGSPLPFLG